MKSNESNMTVIINDVIENKIESHESAESSHKATVQTEGELLNGIKGAKEQKKTSAIWTYFKINKSDNKKWYVLHVTKKFLEEEVLQPNLTQVTFVSI